jgi:hypothetical protein
VWESNAGSARGIYSCWADARGHEAVQRISADNANSNNPAVVALDEQTASTISPRDWSIPSTQLIGAAEDTLTNTTMLAGDRSPEEIIKSVKKGIYAVNFGGGQVDITNGKFVFSMSEAYLIEDGKVTSPVKGATLIGSGPEAMTQVTMIGNDMRLDPGVGTCGKEGQSVPVGVGQPTLRIDGLTVGGTQ